MEGQSPANIARRSYNTPSSSHRTIRSTDTVQAGLSSNFVVRTGSLGRLVSTIHSRWSLGVTGEFLQGMMGPGWSGGGQFANCTALSNIQGPIDLLTPLMSNQIPHLYTGCGKIIPRCFRCSHLSLTLTAPLELKGMYRYTECVGWCRAG